MSNSVIGQRYAKALMNLAQRNGQEEAVGEGLDAIADVMANSPDLTGFLADAKIPQAAKQQTVAEILSRLQLPPLVDSYVRFVSHKRRLALLEDMRTIYHRLADERLGRAQAQVTLAAPASPEREEHIRASLEVLSGKKITLAVKVDPEIIGGVITRIGSTVRDGSLRHHLSTIRQSIIKG